jgi:hypothetical protein
MHLPNTVREPRAALVEQDQTTASRKAFDVPHEQRLIPRRDEITCDPTDEDDVRPAIADELIGDRDSPLRAYPTSSSCMARVSLTEQSTAIRRDRGSSVGREKRSNRGRRV